jgi:hypothetical protein
MPAATVARMVRPVDRLDDDRLIRGRGVLSGDRPSRRIVGRGRGSPRPEKGGEFAPDGRCTLGKRTRELASGASEMGQMQK